jgi:glucose/mannose-6-phosphate isomerase
MDLDDRARFRELDTQDMRLHIDRLPGQFEAAWVNGQTLPLPDSFKRIDKIVIAGMGGSAIAGDLLAALVADSCNIPIIVNRNYELPAYADGQSTLVVGSSYSGETEETLSAIEQADARGTKFMAITTGGRLAQYAQKAGAPAWTFDYLAPPRAALGWSFGLLLALVCRLGLVRDLSADVADAVEVMGRAVPVLSVDSPVVKNPAKRLAGQLIGRVPVIYAGGLLAPVARRWKTQINENGKSIAQWEELPEVNHNGSAGISFPPPLMTKVALIMLVSPKLDHPRLALQQKITQELYLHEGLPIDVVKTRGNSPLANMMSAVQFGDYVSYYVAIAYGVDPTPVMLIEELKEKLAAKQ